MKRAELGDSDGEGMVTFLDGDERLFRLYRPAGAFPDEVTALVGDLT